MLLTISLGQMNIALGELQQNLETVREMTAEAARRGSDIVVFPELWSTGYDLENAANHATPVDEGIFAETCALAQQYGLHILGSNLSLLGEEQYGNTAVLFGPDGSSLGTYTKVHLFGPMEEDRFLTPGDNLGLVETIWGKVGLAICYDLRFPEVTRAYAVAGAKIIFLPSEWPYPRLEHWRTLLRARAIENQVFIVACNRVGASGDESFFGHSTIVDPAGEIVVEGGEGEMLLTATIDLTQIEKVRSLFNVCDDRQPDIYGHR
jgi:predicted amidohydrolase